MEKPDSSQEFYFKGIYPVDVLSGVQDGLVEVRAKTAFLHTGAYSDGKPRQFVSKRCVNLISGLLEYQEDVKENDHAVDALRYSLPLELEEKPFLYVVRC